MRKRQTWSVVESDVDRCLGYGLTPQSLDTEEKQVRFYHILTEVFKFAYGKRSALGDEYDSQTEKNKDIERVRNACRTYTSAIRRLLVTPSDPLAAVR